MDYDIIRDCLTSGGYTLEMSRVETESEFTARLRLGQFDMVLSDFNLPGFDAFQALSICNEICPDTPFICISVAIGEETAIDLLKLGATDFVMKDKLGRLPFVFGRALVEMEEKKARKMAEKELNSSEKQLFNYEADLVTQKGNTRNVIINAFITGEVITGMIMDISARKNAEQALTDKVADLQRFHNLTVGRELSMIVLKKEVNDLLKKSGCQEKYKIVG